MRFFLKSKLWFTVILLFLTGCTCDFLPLSVWDSSPQPDIVLTTATLDELHCFKTLLEEKKAKCGSFKEHYIGIFIPDWKRSRSGFLKEDHLGNWFYEHHLKRVEEGNAYHLYSVSTPCGRHLGFIHLGVMPTQGYCLPKHCAIVDKWVSLGVIEKTCPEDHSLQRVDNRGLAFILPILRDDLTCVEKKSAIEASVEMLESFRCEGELLPNENTLPYQVIGLFKPSNDLIESFKEAGFCVDENEGFYQFYHKPRVMVTKPLG